MKIVTNKFYAILLAIAIYFLYILMINQNPANIGRWIRILSVVGWLLWAYCLYSWKKIGGKVFSLYTIFVSFMILFSYGQCLMWAFGIHLPTEIGEYSSIAGVAIASELTIFKTQLFSIVSILFFHCGALVIFDTHSMNISASSDQDNNDYEGIIRNVCSVTLVISSVCTYYIWIGNMILNRTLGYGAYLYSDASLGRSNIITLLSWMFLPSIIGVLLSYHYQKWPVRICYGLFLGYIVICSLAGYRSWIYEAVVLLWIHNEEKGKIGAVSIIKGAAFGYVIIILSSLLKYSRQLGVSLDTLANAMSTKENPIVGAFFEMGSSMQIVTIILSTEKFKYPYGNTYLLSLPGMITDRIIQFFNPEYMNIGGWFSQVYLKLVGRGMGFSMLGEALVNYGLFLAPIWLLFMGIIMSKWVFPSDAMKNLFGKFFRISTCMMLMPLPRNTFLSTMKKWTFSTLSLTVVIYVLGNILNRNRSRR
ncbi:O-antigen polysaccharide polymerase Wzy [Kandleria vitulina]|uniref:O-antigen polysaccharide polymerase Wzy n=1 Tax=Kandleria vitulina TaxID=1630 RepID=A0A1H2VPZ0_9FIRM|nr:O-antigen polysaccharide polymerase Wzy [Kandleria vitulina]SDW69929.1 O-antigen polysaccharide polymerase Wzy [Kandleria vitulina]